MLEAWGGPSTPEDADLDFTCLCAARSTRTVLGWATAPSTAARTSDVR